MEHFNIHGVVPISASQITTMMSDMHRSLILEMQMVLRNNCGTNATESLSDSNLSTGGSQSEFMF